MINDTLVACGDGSRSGTSCISWRKDQGSWEDFHTFAASGPGSKRGLNRVMGRRTESHWPEREFREVLAILRNRVNKKLLWWAGHPITAQDLQNCLCEFDKYERARLGEGRPKQKYRPKRS